MICSLLLHFVQDDTMTWKHLPYYCAFLSRIHQSSTWILFTKGQQWGGLMFSLLTPLSFNSLGPSDAIWHWRSWSTLVQVMACCLSAPSHYLNQCWLIISKVLWHSSEDTITRRFEDTDQFSKIEDYIFKITLRSPRGQWVNLLYFVVILYIKIFFCRVMQRVSSWDLHHCVQPTVICSCF